MVCNKINFAESLQIENLIIDIVPEENLKVQPILKLIKFFCKTFYNKLIKMHEYSVCYRAFGTGM